MNTNPSHKSITIRLAPTVSAKMSLIKRKSKSDEIKGSEKVER
ncbi:hypothetical protein CPS_3256 [Colwellia psychrerythraea 34H]|uniref:Uncharacterized protein n=1 Tax=Colwellia psychrerythraea (strain 34H / ATCC BAA-681) TaxID=167879 RepID=Q47Z24_COLP3|nr:hypothetical protein CPS_3256 [Colwellia psychrerythraea 34H]